MRLREIWRRKFTSPELIQIRHEKQHLVERQRQIRILIKDLEARAKVLIRQP